MSRTLHLRLLLSAAVAASASSLNAQERRDEQFHYPGSFNWQFLKHSPDAARLFHAFDYGHAALYERLLTSGASIDSTLAREYRFLTQDLLRKPPRFAVAEEAVMPVYAKLAWKAKQMFDWAHVLHRQIYDAYADDRLTAAEKDHLIERLTDYYLTRTELAFTPVPKSMALMDDQWFSQTFRKTQPRFNGLIWAYHWLQVGLYEPMIVGTSPQERKAGMAAATARFWQMVETGGFPRTMPMTPAVAPEFTRRHPRAAAIFDNLHMMHDIIADILALNSVPVKRKRELIYQQLAEFRDPTRNVMSLEEWRTMGGVGGHEGH